MIETGTATTGMRVARHSRRKTKTTSTTSAMEMKSVASTFLTDARIVAVWSSAIVRSMPGFMAACSWGSAALIPSTVEIDVYKRQDAERRVGDQEGKERPDARGGKRGQDRDRMDVALIQDAEDDVDGGDRGGDQKRLVCERVVERLRRPAVGAGDRGRHPRLLLRRVDQVDGVAQRHPRREVERYRDRGKDAGMVHRQGGGRGAEVGEGREGNHAASRRRDVDVPQRIGVLPELGSHLHHDEVLVDRREGRGDLPFPEAVIQDVVYGRGRDAQARGRGPVDDEIGCQPVVLRVARHVRQLVDVPHRVEQSRAPLIQLVQVVALDRVLVLGGALPAADPHVLDGLEDEGRPGDLGELRPKPVDDLRGRDVSLVARLEGDEDAPGVGRGAAAAAREGDHRGDRGVLFHDVDEGRDLARHRLERRVLVRDDGPVEAPGVLLREKVLGYHDVEKHVQPEGPDGDEEDQHGMPKHPGEAALIDSQDPFEGPLAGQIQLAMGLLAAEQARAHHRGRGEGDGERDEDGDG